MNRNARLEVRIYPAGCLIWMILLALLILGITTLLKFIF